MNFNIPILIVSFIYLLLVLVLFLSKKKQNNIENTIYTYLLIISIFGVLIDICGIYAHLNLPDTSILRYLIVKFYMLYLLTFTYLISIYIICIGKNIENVHKIIHGKKYFITISLYLFFSTLNFLLPFNYFNDGTIVYIYGLNCTYLYLFTAINMFFWIFNVIKRRKTISKRKILPIITFVILCIPVILIQMYNPQFLLVTSLSAFIVVFMYHTIENPDIKMLHEFKKNKEYAENVNKEKELFLFNITQDIRTPLMDIKDACTQLSTLNDKTELQKGIRYINAKSNNIINLVNDVLDISDMDISNIKIVNNKYNPKLLLESVAKNFKAEVNGNIDFRINIDKSIPDSLYGDSIRIKQVLKILLENANKYTNKGFIELSAHEITKRNICRLIITIEDSGKGISADELSNIFDKDNIKTDNLEKIDDRKSNLAVAKIVFSLLGGLLTFYSEIGAGTKFTLILDQRIDEDKSIELEKIEQFSESITKPSVIVVSEDQNYLNKAVKKLSKNLDVVGVDLGAKAIEKVRKNQRYDYILLDEDLEILNIGTVLTKLKEINGFKSQVYVLVRDLKNDKYLKLGFDKIISRRLTSKEIEQLDEK